MEAAGNDRDPLKSEADLDRAGVANGGAVAQLPSVPTATVCPLAADTAARFVAAPTCNRVTLDG